jgi:hypothetical protein
LASHASYDAGGNVIETHEHAGVFRELKQNFILAVSQALVVGSAAPGELLAASNESDCWRCFQQPPIDTRLRLFTRNPLLAFGHALDEPVILLESPQYSMRYLPIFLQPVPELLARHKKLERLTFRLSPQSQVAQDAKRISVNVRRERVVNLTLNLWQAGNLKATDEFRHDGQSVWYPVSKIRRGLETSRAAMVGYGLLAGVLLSILVGLLSWALYLLFH